MTDERTDEQKLEDRREERALHAQGLVRVPTYLANLAIQCDIPVERGPRIRESKTDQGCYVPVWLEWHLIRFPQNKIPQRRRLEVVARLRDDHKARYLMLVEAQLAGGTLYDPSGDIATEAALHLLKKELPDDE